MFNSLHYSDCIVFLLAKANQKATNQFKRHLTEFGLTPIQVLVIQALQEEEGISAIELGKKLVLDSATLSGLLERLAEKGWIIKQLDEVDRRSLKLYLGEPAKKFNEPLSDMRKKVNEDILGNLSIEERVLLKRLLKDIKG
jgi:DNA-binding MarR family transcriptional regulator